MSHPRKPRNALGRLLEAAKTRSGKEWPAIDLELGMSKSTRESWLNGNVRDPSLKAVLRLARLLEIPPAELEVAVLDGHAPEWCELYANSETVNAETRAPESAGVADHGGSADAMSRKQSSRRGRAQRSR